MVHWMDRWAAHLQRKSDEGQARWLELESFRDQVPSWPVESPDGSIAVIRVYQAGTGLLNRGRAVGPTGNSGGGVLAAFILVALAIWWLVFRRAYTVHVRTYGSSPARISIRLPDQVAAYRAAAQLVDRFREEGPVALPGWRADHGRPGPQ